MANLNAKEAFLQGLLEEENFNPYWEDLKYETSDDNPPVIIGVFDCDGTVFPKGVEEASENSKEAIVTLLKLAPIVAMGTKRSGDHGQNLCGQAVSIDYMKQMFKAPELREYFIFGSDGVRENWDQKRTLLGDVFRAWKRIIPGLQKKQIILFDDEAANVEAVQEAGFRAILVDEFINKKRGGLTSDVVKNVNWSNRYIPMFNWYEKLEDFGGQRPSKRSRRGRAMIVSALIKANGNVRAAAQLILSNQIM